VLVLFVQQPKAEKQTGNVASNYRVVHAGGKRGFIFSAGPVWKLKFVVIK
jgi:hypothetical protein